MSDYPRFHYAFPVPSLEGAREFYGATLGCAEGRSNNHWVDFDFFGHQIVAHKSDEDLHVGKCDVDGKKVPIRHFGLILEWDHWHELKEKLEANDAIRFIIKPYIRFEGKIGEQATMFFTDPFGNAIEIKSFKDESMIFESDRDKLQQYA